MVYRPPEDLPHLDEPEDAYAQFSHLGDQLRSLVVRVTGAKFVKGRWRLPPGRFDLGITFRMGVKGTSKSGREIEPTATHTVRVLSDVLAAQLVDVGPMTWIRRGFQSIAWGKLRTYFESGGMGPGFLRSVSVTRFDQKSLATKIRAEARSKGAKLLETVKQDPRLVWPTLRAGGTVREMRVGQKSRVFLARELRKIKGQKRVVVNQITERRSGPGQPWRRTKSKLVWRPQEKNKARP